MNRTKFAALLVILMAALNFGLWQRSLYAGCFMVNLLVLVPVLIEHFTEELSR